MTVIELIEQLEALPQNEQVYRWDSDRQADGSETVRVCVVEMGPVDLYQGEPPAVRVVIR